MNSTRLTLTVILAAALMWVAGAASLALATDIPTDGVVLRGLDKVTGKVSTMPARVDSPVAFGRLEIIPRTCVTRPPEEPPENTAFLEVYETPPGQDRRRIFSGWMFASSPALSALDHPVYDIWVLRCENSKSSSTG